MPASQVRRITILKRLFFYNGPIGLIVFVSLCRDDMIDDNSTRRILQVEYDVLANVLPRRPSLPLSLRKSVPCVMQNPAPQPLLGFLFM